MWLARVIVAIVLFSLASGVSAAEPARLPDKGRIPVMAWIGIPPEQSSVERYRELADCGFTINFTGYSDLTAASKALDAAQQAGVQVLVTCPELIANPEQTAKQLKDHPALAGYFLRDEPAVPDFAGEKMLAEKIRAADPKHIIYVNLLPDYANSQQLGAPTYQRYVDQFVETVPATFLSFDYYPIVRRSVRPGWYQNLAVIAATARRADKPFWAFALSLRHFDYPIATMPDLREQVYSDLAYGAQGIQYFTYWKPSGLDSGDSPIDAKGNRTVVYDRVKQMNAEIRALSPVFLGSKVVSLGHTGGSLPPGTQQFHPSAPLKSVHAKGEGVLVSLLENDGRQFLVVVNHDIQHQTPLAIRFDGSQAIERVAKDGRLNRVRGDRADDKLEPGDAVIFTWPAKAPQSKP